MKIVDSNIIFSSDNNFSRMDLSLEEKSETKNIRLIRQSLIRQSPIDESSDIQQILVERVSISQKEKFEYQYNYSGSLTGKASVKSMATGDITDHENQYAIERLIGGVIDKNVAVKHIQRKEDIRLSGRKNSEVENSDRKKQNIQAQMAASQSAEMKLVQTDIHFEEESVQFASTGQVSTEDGRVIDFSLDLSLERSFLSRREQESIVQRWQERVNLTDPLVISLEGKIPQLSDATFEFDLNSDGKMENISFVNPGSGFLAFDKNSDSKINNGSELFGPGSGNGFEELAAFDEDHNMWIDENDSVFSKLSVWTKGENGEDLLVSLKDSGIGAIALANADTMFNMTEFDNSVKGQLKSSGMFLFENGDVGSVHQIDLADRREKIIQKEKEQPLLSNAPDRQPNVPEFPPPLQMLDSRQLQEELSNPLQDLIDRIEKLREEMERLYENMNPALNHDRFSRSKSRHYYNFNPDPSILLFGDQRPALYKSWLA